MGLGGDGSLWFPCLVPASLPKISGPKTGSTIMRHIHIEIVNIQLSMRGQDTAKPISFKSQKDCTSPFLS
jgi:hypothetical protein